MAAAYNMDLAPAMAEARRPSLLAEENAKYASQSGLADSDGDPSEPTPEEMKTLRRVSGKIPWQAYTITFVELCERFSWYGTTALCMSPRCTCFETPLMSHSREFCSAASAPVFNHWRNHRNRGVLRSILERRVYAARGSRPGPTSVHGLDNLQSILGLCYAADWRLHR